MADRRAKATLDFNRVLDVHSRKRDSGPTKKEAKIPASSARCHSFRIAQQQFIMSAAASAVPLAAAPTGGWQQAAGRKGLHAERGWPLTLSIPIAPKKKNNKKKKNANKPKDPLEVGSKDVPPENDENSDEPQTPVMVLPPLRRRGDAFSSSSRKLTSTRNRPARQTALLRPTNRAMPSPTPTATLPPRSATAIP